MLKIKSFFSLCLGIIFLSVLTSPVLAGGWPIYTWSWDNADAWRSDYKLTYVRAHLAPDVPCKGTTVTFKYQNPQSGDNVSAGGDNGTYTFTENGAKYSKYNGAMIPDCSTYAKFYSTNNILKTGIAEFKTADGKTYTATFALNFHLPTPGNTDAESKYPLPWEEDYIKKTSSPSPRPLSCASCDADVNKDGNVDISDFSLVKFCQDKTPADSCLNADINKDNNIDDTDRQCWQKNLGSFCKENSKDAGPGFTPLDVPQPKIQPSQLIVVSDSSASSALQKKVDELQKKLEESQQRQSLLEKQLNQLLTWIKSVFPFFK